MHGATCLASASMRPRRRRLRFGDKPSGWGPRPSARPAAGPCGAWHPKNLVQHWLDRWKQLSTNTSDSCGRLLYLYFNWRQDTSKDLFLILSMFSAFVLLGSTIRHWVIDTQEERDAATGFWNDVYQVSVLPCQQMNTLLKSSYRILLQFMHNE